MLDADTKKLHELGYAQELRRRMGGFSNFAVSFTIISILSGCLTAYGIAMTNGGPVDMTWGWLFVGLMTTIVGLGMAEVCSAYPTAGGLYYWSAKPGQAQQGRLELVLRVGSTSSGRWPSPPGSISVSALFFNAFLNLTTGWAATPGHTVIIYAGILVVHAALNIFGVRVVAFLSDVSVWWHHPRRAGDRDLSARHTVPPCLAVVRLHRSGQRDRLPQQLLRLHDRSAPGPVHLHRI